MVWDIKMTKYCRESEIFTIYPIGTHSCLPKPNTKKYGCQGREADLRNSGLGTFALQLAEVDGAVEAGDILQAWRRAVQPCYTNLRYKNRSIGPELTTSKTGPIHLSSLVEIAFVDWFTKLLLINVSIYMNI